MKAPIQVRTDPRPTPEQSKKKAGSKRRGNRESTLTRKKASAE
jgi:hypothetical protein